MSNNKRVKLGIFPIDSITLVVSEDEPCLGLFEMNLQSPGSRGMHRYQILEVMRDDRVAQAWIDLGLAKDIKADQLRILGGDRDETTGKFWIEHTVGELRDIADWRRGDNLFDKRELVQVNNLKE